MKRVLIAFVLALLTMSCAAPPAPGPGNLDEGTPTLLEETIVSYKGKPVVVNYWATWCAPCKAEMPRFVAAAKRYDGRVRFLGVNVEDDAQAAEAFIKDKGIPFRSLSDVRGDIRRAQRILGLPGTEFYDAAGDLVFLKQGEIKADELEQKIQDTLRSS